MRERERERDSERARENQEQREKERERERECVCVCERERERDESEYPEMQNCNYVPDNFPVVDSGPISLGFSRESPAADTLYYVAYVYNGELVPLMGNQRVGIFPPKSKILFVLSLALIWCRNFQDRTIPVGGDTWSSCSSERRIIIIIRIRTRKKPYASVWEAVRNKHGSKVAGQSCDRRPTVKQLFSEVSSNWNNLWKKSLNGHVTVVGDHATVGRLSNNIFSTFQAIRHFLKKVAERSPDNSRPVGWLSNNVFWTFQAVWENFEKSRWTVTRQWLRSRDCRPTVKQRFWTFQAIRIFFEKSRWKVTRQWSEVTRPSADCQTTFFGCFKQFEKILKKVAERSRDSGRRSRDRRLTVKQRFWTFQAIRKLFVKTHRRVTRQWSVVTRQWSVVTRLSVDCQAHICMYIIINESERERERAREREREREGERERDRERER